MTLVKATINYEQVLKPLQATELRRLTEAMRYISELNSLTFPGLKWKSFTAEVLLLTPSHRWTKDKTKRRNNSKVRLRLPSFWQFAALQAITLENKSDDELINLLKHSEELMRGRALELLYERIVNLDQGTFSFSLNKIFSDGFFPNILTRNTWVQFAATKAPRTGQALGPKFKHENHRSFENDDYHFGKSHRW